MNFGIDAKINFYDDIRKLTNRMNIFSLIVGNLKRDIDLNTHVK